jgi:hypothetical protein
MEDPPYRTHTNHLEPRYKNDCPCPVPVSRRNHRLLSRNNLNNIDNLTIVIIYCTLSLKTLRRPDVELKEETFTRQMSRSKSITKLKHNFETSSK